MLNRRALSDVFPETSRGSRRKEGARQVEFVRIGQVSAENGICYGNQNVDWDYAYEGEVLIRGCC